MVKLTYDPEVDACYVAFVEMSPGISAQTLSIEPFAGALQVNADLDRNGNLVGLEFIGAREVFSEAVLARASRD